MRYCGVLALGGRDFGLECEISDYPGFWGVKLRKLAKLLMTQM